MLILFGAVVLFALLALMSVNMMVDPSGRLVTVRRLLRNDAGWLVISLVVVYAVYVVALLLDHRHFFAGDTQNAYYGWMYEFGTALRHGHWPMLSVSEMAGGNHIAEGQMGLYNPLMALMALGSTVATNLLVYATFLKFLIAGIGVVGAFVLCRYLGVGQRLSAAAACAMPLCGVTLGYEVGRWMLGLLVAALLPWAWWGVARAMRGRSIVLAIILGGLVVTVGYVFGTGFLAIVYIAVVVQALLQRDWRAVRRALVVGIACGLIAVAVYLPGVLTASVSTRTDTIGGHGQLQIVGPDYLLLGEPIGTTWMPVNYLSWLLPLVTLVHWRALRRDWRAVAAPVIVALLMLGWSRLPYNLGPLRWPGRTNDFLTLSLVVLLAVVLTRYPAPQPRRRIAALLVVMALVAVVGTLHLGLGHPGRPLAILGTCAVLAALLVFAVWRWDVVRGPSRAAAAVLLGGTLAVGVVLTVLNPKANVSDRLAPTSLSAYDQYLPGTVGHIVVISDKGPRYTAERARYLLAGNQWVLTGKSVASTDTPVEFRAYARRFCDNYIGDYCPHALAKMFKVEPVTGRPWVDLLSISSLVIGRNGPNHDKQPPAGWHVAARNPITVTWVRDQPRPTAGGVVWTSPGLQVRESSTSNLGTSFVVEHVPAKGGTAVLSRLAWPGYRVSGASLSQPLAGTLLTVKIPAEAAGRSVSVTFRPPGWGLEVASLIGAAGILLVALFVELVAAVSQLRNKRMTYPPPSPPQKAADLLPTSIS
jgi:hypothetical protein